MQQCAVGQVGQGVVVGDVLDVLFGFAVLVEGVEYVLVIVGYHGLVELVRVYFVFVDDHGYVDLLVGYFFEFGLEGGLFRVVW